MSIFTSAREKRYWILAALVMVTIFSTLFSGNPLLELFRSQNIQAVMFLVVMFFVGVTILLHGILTNTGKYDWVIIIGLFAVYLMLFLRLGLAERSHVLEFSVLAIFVHSAMNERLPNRFLKSAFISFCITFAIGLIDEVSQLFIPERVFDINDIVFNGMAAFFAIGFYTLVKYFKRK